MPRPGPRRPLLTVRVDPDQAVWLATEATRRETSQGLLVRELLTKAMKRPTPKKPST